MRGTPHVDAEFADIVEAVENGKNVNKWAIFQRKYRPVLVSELLLTYSSQGLCVMQSLFACLSNQVMRYNFCLSVSNSHLLPCPVPTFVFLQTCWTEMQLVNVVSMR